MWWKDEGKKVIIEGECAAVCAAGVPGDGGGKSVGASGKECGRARREKFEIGELAARQRTYFQTGATLPVERRLAALRRLYAAVSASEGEIREALKEDLMIELRRHFRPEFLNRIDETLIFHALTKEEIKQIVDIQLKRLAERLADQEIALEVTPAAYEVAATLDLSDAFVCARVVSSDLPGWLAATL